MFDNLLLLAHGKVCAVSAQTHARKLQPIHKEPLLDNHWDNMKPSRARDALSVLVRKRCESMPFEQN